MATVGNLCGCQVFPERARSLINHGNCVALFDNADCTANPLAKLEPGRSPLSSNLNGLKAMKSILRIAPCVEPLHCLK